MDCIEKFQGMRDCFQEYPEVYKDELADDEELDRELEQEKQELTQQIRERREKDLAQEQEGGRRLLEEEAPKARVKATRKIEEEQGAPTGDPSPASPSTQVSAEKTSKPSPEPTAARADTAKPALSGEEKENIHEGQSSQTISSRSPPPVSAEADPVDELIPKAAFDARETKA
jgi:hypothetical protein